MEQVRFVSAATTRHRSQRSIDDSAAPAFFKTPSAPTRIDSVGLPPPVTNSEPDAGDVWDSHSFLVAATPATTESAASTERLWAVLLYCALAADGAAALFSMSSVEPGLGPPISRRTGDAYGLDTAAPVLGSHSSMADVWRSLSTVYGWPPLLAPGQLTSVSGLIDDTAPWGIARGIVGPPEAQPPYAGSKEWDASKQGRLLGTLILLCFGAVATACRPSAPDRAALWAWLVQHGPSMTLRSASGRQGNRSGSKWDSHTAHPSGHDSAQSRKGLPRPILLVALRVSLLPVFLAMLWITALLGATGVWPAAGIVSGSLSTPAVTYAASGASEYYTALVQLVCHIVCAWCAHRVVMHGGPVWYSAGGSLSAYC